MWFYGVNSQNYWEDLYLVQYGNQELMLFLYILLTKLLQGIYNQYISLIMLQFMLVKMLGF